MTEFVPFECQACHHGYVRMVAGTNRVMPYCREFGLLVPDDLLIPTCGACGETFQNVEEAEAMARQQVALLSRTYLAVSSSPQGYAILCGFENADTPGEFDETAAKAGLEEFDELHAPDYLDALEAHYKFMSDTASRDVCIAIAYARKLEAELKQERIDHNMTATHLAHAALSDNRLIRFFETLTPEDEALLTYAAAIDAGEDPKT